MEHERSIEQEQRPVEQPSPPSAFPLLRLPLEIRLQIYQWVLRLGIADAGTAPSSAAVSSSPLAPVPSAVLLPLIGDYAFPPFAILGAGGLGLFGSTAHQETVHFRRVKKGDKTLEETEDKEILPACRPAGRAVPSGLLTACRQVYNEARAAPFETCEFAFVPLFSSGLSTAHAFVVLGQRLQPWQRRRLRHMRLEMSVESADMGWSASAATATTTPTTTAAPPKTAMAMTPATTGLDATKWLTLCSVLAAGLQTLRLRLRVMGHGPKGDDGDALDPEQLAQAPVVRGLCRLAALRRLEVEIVKESSQPGTPKVPVVTVLGWCAAVERIVNEARRRTRQDGSRPDWGSGSPSVVCVERIRNEDMNKQKKERRRGS